MLENESSLAVPEDIKTYTIRKLQESFNQNILQDQPKDDKKEAPAL